MYEAASVFAIFAIVPIGEDDNHAVGIEQPENLTGNEIARDINLDLTEVRKDEIEEQG